MSDAIQYHSEQLGELAAALAKAQAEMRHAAKSLENPFFHSSYAGLPDVLDATRSALAKHGLSVTQITDLDPSGAMVLVTMLLHSSGQWIRGFYPVRPVKADPQGIGSAITYARRYAYQAICCAASAEEDDDGNAASRPQNGQAKNSLPSSGGGGGGGSFHGPRRLPSVSAKMAAKQDPEPESFEFPDRRAEPGPFDRPSATAPVARREPGDESPELEQSELVAKSPRDALVDEIKATYARLKALDSKASWNRWIKGNPRESSEQALRLALDSMRHALADAECARGS